MSDTDVKSGLSGPGTESGPPSDDSILDAHFAKVASGEDTPAEAEPEAPRGRGKEALHYRGTPTTHSEGGGPAKLTADELAAFVAPDEHSTDIATSLRFGPEPKPEPTPRSGRELADEQIARQREIEASDPGWQSWREKQSDGVGNHAELLARRLDEAITEGNEALIMARGREFLAGAPAAYAELIESNQVEAITEANELGDDEYDETQDPWYRFDADVRESLAQERAQAQYAQATAKINGLVGKNIDEYEQRLAEADLAPRADDQQSIDYYSSLADWVALSTGVHPGQLANSNPSLAAEWMQKADHQMETWQHSLTTHAVQQSVLGAEDGSVASGLETSADRTDALLKQQNELLRAQNGLEPAGSPSVPNFNPNDVEIPPSRREREDRPMTIGSFRRGLVEGEGIKAEGAWMRGGKPVSFEQASHDPVAAAADRAARIRASGLN